MRRLIVCVLSLVLAVVSSAQDIPAVTCPDGTSVDPLLSLSLPAQPPAKRDDLPEPYFVSVITDKTKPTLAISDDTGLVTCAPQDTLAETVQATFGADLEMPMVFGSTPYSSWVSAETDTAKTAAIGQLDGPSLIVIEGGAITSQDREGDVYTLAFDPTLIDHFDVTVLGIDEAYQPGLSLVDETNTVLPVDVTQPTITFDDVSPITYNGLRVPSYESKATDVQAEITPQASNTLHLRVESAAGEGAYTLLIRFSLPEPEPQKISAQVVSNFDGTWTVQCDGTPAFENGLKMDMFTEQPEDIHPGLDLAAITPETPMTLTALSADTPVVMAVMTSDTEGYCVQQSPDASSYAIALPDLDVPPTLNGAQVVLTQAPQAVLVGSLQPTSVALVVEGWDAPTFEGALHSYLHPLFQLNVTPSSLDNGIRLYGIAADDSTNPAVGVLIPSANFILMCDNAAVPDECTSDSTSLTGYTITLAEGRVLPGASLDAMLRFNTVDAAPDPAINVYPLQIAANDQTGQGKSLVIVTAFTLSSPEQSSSQ